jgi:hypothetical protein
MSSGAVLSEPLSVDPPGAAVVGIGPTAVFGSAVFAASGEVSGVGLPAGCALEPWARLPVAITSAAADARKNILFMTVS